MKKYSDYKNSGVEWIEEIPKKWSFLQFKNTISNIKNGTSSQQISDETDFAVTRIETISTGIINFQKVGYVDWFDGLNSYKLNKGDILLSNINSLAMIGNCAQYMEDTPLYAGMNLLRIIPKKEVDYRWLYYLTISHYFKNCIVSEAKPAINQASIPTTKIKSIHIPFPCKPVQELIASYLDRKTAQIDSIIADKVRLIDLLKEKRQAIISEAVTKGLDPTVPMKDSGVDWIGQIPAHWDIKPLFTVTFENKNKNIGNQCANLLSLSYGNIIKKDIEANFGLLPESFESYQIVEKGYTILRLTDLQNDKRSLRSGFVHEKGIITSAYVGLSPTIEIDGLFLSDLLHAYDLMKIFYSLGNGVRQSMNYKDLKRLPILLPPKQEQKLISNYLKVKTSEINNLIASTEQQISLLKEYRQSIISEAVTGKVKIDGGEY